MTSPWRMHFPALGMLMRVSINFCAPIYFSRQEGIIVRASYVTKWGICKVKIYDMTGLWWFKLNYTWHSIPWYFNLMTCALLCHQWEVIGFLFLISFIRSLFFYSFLGWGRGCLNRYVRIYCWVLLLTYFLLLLLTLLL